MPLDDLPSELLADILGWLDFRSIIRAQLVCKIFNDLIKRTPELQYVIETAVAGVIECSPALCTTPIATRLHQLRARQAAWKAPHPTRVRAALLEGKYGRVDLVDGILVRTHMRAGPENILQSFDHITAMALNPTHLGPLPHWDMDFDAEMCELAMDPSQDLLILIENLPLAVTGNGLRCRLRIFSLTRGSKHPKALMESLEVPGAPESPSHVVGDLLAWFATLVEAEHATADYPDSPGEGLLCFLNWKTGVLRTMPMKGMFTLEGALCLLSSGHFLLSSLSHRPNSYEEYLTMNLFSVNTDLSSPRSSVDRWYTHLAQYELPRLLHDHDPNYTFSLDFHSPNSCRRASAFPEFGALPPFQADPYSGLVGIELTKDPFLQPPPPAMPIHGPQWMLILDTTLFEPHTLAPPPTFTSSRGFGRTPIPPPVVCRYKWADWGPQHCAWFVDGFPRFVTRDHMYGPRLILRDAILDFNTLEIARDRARLACGSVVPGWENVYCKLDEDLEGMGAFFALAELGRSQRSYRRTPLSIPEAVDAVLWLDEGIVAISRDEEAEVHLYSP